MRAPKYAAEVDSILRDNVFVRVEDISRACPGMSMPGVYSRINKLLQENRLTAVGKGRYVSAPKPEYVVEITPWMREVNEYLMNSCCGVNICIAEREGNLFVQVHKSEMDKIQGALEGRYSRVIRKGDFRRFPGKLEGYIVLGHLVSESPLLDENGILVPSLEKTMVDGVSDGEIALGQLSLQKTAESYPLNLDTLLRYAARRGIKDKVSSLVNGLDKERMEMMAKVQKYLSSVPVARAWVFGSFARGEETPESDLDLMVDYVSKSNLSLLDVIRFKLDLESIIGREVDWVENGYLKPFAAPSAEKDKYLIYER